MFPTSVLVLERLHLRVQGGEHGGVLLPHHGQPPLLPALLGPGQLNLSQSIIQFQSKVNFDVMWSFKSCQFDNVSLIGAQTKHFNLFTFFQKMSHSLQKLPCSPLTLTTLVKRFLCKVQTPLTAVRISDDSMFGADISLG